MLKEKVVGGVGGSQQHSGSGTMLPKTIGYEAWNMKNNNSNVSTIIDY